MESISELLEKEIKKLDFMSMKNYDIHIEALFKEDLEILNLLIKI